MRVLNAYARVLNAVRLGVEGGGIEGVCVGVEHVRVGVEHIRTGVECIRTGVEGGGIEGMREWASLV